MTASQLIPQYHARRARSTRRGCWPRRTRLAAAGPARSASTTCSSRRWPRRSPATPTSPPPSSPATTASRPRCAAREGARRRPRRRDRPRPARPGHPPRRRADAAPSIAAERARLVDAARAGRLALAEMSGARRSRSRTSARFGVDRFTAMVNPGESAILAVGRTVERVVPARPRPRGRADPRRSPSPSTTASSTAPPAPPRWPSSPTCSRRRWRGGRERRGARRRRRVRDRPRLRRRARRARLAASSSPTSSRPTGDAGAVALDVRDRDAVAPRSTRGAERARPLGAVVYAAGTARVTPILEIEPREWDLVVGVNLTGAFNVLQARRAAHARRRLVHVDLLDRLRLAGRRPRPLLRREGRGRGARRAPPRSSSAPRGVRCNAVLPGVVRTPLMAPHARRARRSRDAFVAQTPLRRHRRGADDSPTSSPSSPRPAARWITGVSLPGRRRHGPARAPHAARPTTDAERTAPHGHRAADPTDRHHRRALPSSC